MTIKNVKASAKKHGWEFYDYQRNNEMLSFVKDIGGHRARINVYVSKMTVTTCINHPKKGKTQLFRKKVDYELLNKIFENPRIHTDKGYRTK